MTRVDTPTSAHHKAHITWDWPHQWPHIHKDQIYTTFFLVWKEKGRHLFLKVLPIILHFLSLSIKISAFLHIIFQKELTQPWRQNGSAVVLVWIIQYQASTCTKVQMQWFKRGGKKSKSERILPSSLLVEETPSETCLRYQIQDDTRIRPQQRLQDTQGQRAESLTLNQKQVSAMISPYKLSKHLRCSRSSSSAPSVNKLINCHLRWRLSQDFTQNFALFTRRREKDTYLPLLCGGGDAFQWAVWFVMSGFFNNYNFSLPSHENCVTQSLPDSSAALAPSAGENSSHKRNHCKLCASST